jgi:beta-galactosidase/beta-glucuronidase
MYPVWLQKQPPSARCCCRVLYDATTDMYRQRDSAFLDTVTEEIRHQVRRLSFHPSVVIWSANNENEAALGGWYVETRDNPFRYVVDYEVLYTNTVRQTLLQFDTTRPYLPSSPSNGIIEEDPYVQRWGDVTVCQSTLTLTHTHSHTYSLSLSLSL